MTQGFTKIFGVKLNDSRRRLKRRDSDASVESSGSTRSSSSSSASSSASTSSADCFSSSSSSPSYTPPLSPSTHVPEHVHLSDAEVDGVYSYPVNTFNSTLSYGSQHGDIDIDEELRKQWTCSPPPEHFQMKRMGRGSRGRTRPTLPASEGMKNHHAQHTERQRDWL